MYLEPWSWIKTFNYFAVIEEAVSSISYCHHTPTSTINVYTIHISEGQPYMGRRLGKYRKALIGSVYPLCQAQHWYCWKLVDGIQRSLSIK